MTNKTYQLETLSCPTCAGKIEKMLSKLEGVKNPQVAFMSSKVKLSFDESVISSQQIEQKLSNFGYQVIGEN